MTPETIYRQMRDREDPQVIWTILGFGIFGAFVGVLLVVWG